MGTTIWQTFIPFRFIDFDCLFSCVIRMRFLGAFSRCQIIAGESHVFRTCLLFLSFVYSRIVRIVLTHRVAKLLWLFFEFAMPLRWPSNNFDGFMKLCTCFPPPPHVVIQNANYNRNEMKISKFDIWRLQFAAWKKVRFPLFRTVAQKKWFGGDAHSIVSPRPHSQDTIFCRPVSHVVILEACLNCALAAVFDMNVAITWWKTKMVELPTSLRCRMNDDNNDDASNRPDVVIYHESKASHIVAPFTPFVTFQIYCGVGYVYAFY